MASLPLNNFLSGGERLSNFIKKPNENDVPSKNQSTIQKVALTIIAILALAIAIASGIVACILCQPLLGILTGASAGIALLCLGSLLCYRKKASAPESPRTGPSPAPEVSPTPDLGFPTHDVLLSKHWDRKRDLNEVLPNATLADPNQRCNIWKLTPSFGPSSIILIDTEGDITKPRVNIENASIMFVNAANPEMNPGGGGTNAAFTKAVTDRCWENSKQSINTIDPKSHLEVGECRSGKWEGRDDNHRFGNTQHFFAQLLGPRASQCNNDEETARKECRRAYIRCFCEAKRNKVNVVQLPLISSGIYAPTSDENRDKWLQAVRSALISAAQDFSEVKNNDLIIILTGIQGPQLAQD
ncbi:macro domain-containing protein [Chlamydia pecorum]|uniref:macro domain-containing protein n=1 Tax=Chlamydia pecorum TaxID=85991 RepID=UPI0007AFB87B|nr:macro domain-containing protein [Chlamydia pecorum]KZN26934.1 macro domain protein [Chlamydia pecorum]